jgi:hypothetical protein
VRRALSTVALVSLAVTLAACGGGTASSGRAHRAASTPRQPSRRVLMIGDSITYQSQRDIIDAMQRAGWQVVVDGRDGTTLQPGAGTDWGLDWGVEAADLTRSYDPAVAVVELGTNDRSPCCAGVPAAIDNVMRGLSSARVVYWLNVQQHKDFPPQAAQIDALLDAATARWPKLRILDFDAYFGPHPEWHAGPVDVHPSLEGRRRLAAFVVDALRPLEEQRPPA